MKTNTVDQDPSMLGVPPSTRLDRSYDGLPDAAPATSAGGSRMNRIAARAHQIYEIRGGANGKALDDWLQAEREIDEED